MRQQRPVRALASAHQLAEQLLAIEHATAPAPAASDAQVGVQLAQIGQALRVPDHRCASVDRRVPVGRIAVQRVEGRRREVAEHALPVIARLQPRPIVQRAVPSAPPQIGGQLLDQLALVVGGSQAAARRHVGLLARLGQGEVAVFRKCSNTEQAGAAGGHLAHGPPS